MHSSCGTLVRRDDLPRHLMEDCIFREQQCGYCSIKTTADKLEVWSVFYNYLINFYARGYFLVRTVGNCIKI